MASACLRAGSVSKAYAARKNIGGRLVIHTIGVHGDITAEDARAAAVTLLATMKEGVNPNAGRKPVKRPEPLAQRIRRRLPQVHAAHFRDLTEDYGGREFVARDLKIEYPQYDSWYRGEIEPPYYLLVALYFMSTWGRSQAFSESHFSLRADGRGVHQQALVFSHLGLDGCCFPDRVVAQPEALQMVQGPVAFVDVVRVEAGFLKLAIHVAGEHRVPVVHGFAPSA